MATGGWTLEAPVRKSLSNADVAELLAGEARLKTRRAERVPLARGVKLLGRGRPFSHGTEKRRTIYREAVGSMARTDFASFELFVRGTLFAEGCVQQPRAFPGPRRSA